MAQLWFKPKDAELTLLPLALQAVSVSEFPPRPVDRRPGASAPDAVFLERLPDPRTHEDRWFLVAGERADVWVDGARQDLGLYRLADGQEILVAGAGVVVLSTEEPPRIALLPDTGTDVICPRCKTEIEPGTPAVRCPDCKLWHHERDDLPCWTYEHSSHCAMCTQANVLDGALRRIPGGL